MGGPPLFQRSPRLHPELPGGEVEVAAPGGRLSAPAISPISLIMSILPGLLGPLILTTFMHPAGGQRPSYMLYSIPLVLIGGLAQAGNFLYQRHKYHRTMMEREEAYTELLSGKERELSQLRERQVGILQEASPPPVVCLERVQRLDSRLWERSPQDADFLSLRLGVGAVPFSVKVKVPRQEQALNPDPLYVKAYELSAAFEQATGAPICLPLREMGAAGLVGHRPAVLSAMRNLILQIATGHSPDEVKILALFPAEEASDWAWMRWLPHVRAENGRRFLAADKAEARRLLAEVYTFFTQRKNQLAMQDSGSAAPLPAYVLFLADRRLTENEAVVPLLLQDGARLGAFPVVLADRKEDLPMACRGIVEVTSGTGQLTLTVPRLSQVAFAPDNVPVELAEAAGRAMAPIRLRRMTSAAEIPAKVTLFDLLEVDRVEELKVLDRWRHSTADNTLGVPIGLRGGGEKLILDLHDKAHGPHGLIAGATGSGKSELLQTLIASLAVSYHPHEVAFVMVDFKGGGTANIFRGMPHLIGTMTNLEEGNLAQRALDALKAELKRRQRVLAEAAVNHINDYIRLRRKGAQLDPLPHLLIVADEFAELKQAQPEFMRELVSAVRVGRSLGVHLILATQKPAGVVDDQIWSNTRFRLCLRVERPEDSRDVLKCPDAAAIKGSGRAYCQVGNNEIFELFQAGWGGAPYTPGAATNTGALEVAEVGLGGERYRLGTPAATGHVEAGASQLQVLIKYLEAQAAEAGIIPVDSPWLPPLPTYLPIAEVGESDGGWDGKTWRPAGQWLEPVVGLLDDPEHQLQEPAKIRMADGHLLVYGAPGTGKTTFVETLVLSLARIHTPADVHIYLVDCSGRTLSLFQRLPHVGAVVTGDDAERVARLMRWLVTELGHRKERFAELGVSTLTAYRSASQESMPAILVALDNYPVFAATYTECDDMLAQVAREGSSLGIYLVMTATTPSVVRSKITSNVNMAVALQLAERGEYSSAVGRTGGREPMPVPGRGLLKASPPLEFQTALPAAGETEWERTQAIRTLIQEMDAAWTGPRPEPVRVLPEQVPLSELFPAVRRAPGESWVSAVPVGLDVETLAPFCPDLQEGPHFVITGPTEGGKTTLLQTWLLALAAANSPKQLRLWMVDFGGTGLAPLRELPHTEGLITDGTQFAEALTAISQALQGRRQQLEEQRRSGLACDEQAVLAAHPRLVLAIHDLDTMREALPAGTKERLEQLVRRDRGLGLHILASGMPVAFNLSTDPVGRAFKELQTGFVVGGTDLNDLSIIGARLPAVETGKTLPPGTGFYCRRGRSRKFRAASARIGGQALSEWVRAISAEVKATAEVASTQEAAAPPEGGA